MDLAAGLAIYFILWWLTLFAVLPWGIKSQTEAGSVVPGTDASAPVRHRLMIKAGVTTFIAGILWLFVAWIWIYQPIPLDSIPFMPDLGAKY